MFGAWLNIYAAVMISGRIWMLQSLYVNFIQASASVFGASGFGLWASGFGLRGFGASGLHGFGIEVDSCIDTGNGGGDIGYMILSFLFAIILITHTGERGGCKTWKDRLVVG